MSLLEELKQHRDNLAVLELQASLHGLDVPLEIVNNIRHTKAEIERLEKELAKSDAIDDEYTLQFARANVVKRQLGEYAMPEPYLERTLQSIDARVEALRDSVHYLDIRLGKVETRLKHIEDHLISRAHANARIPTVREIGALAMVMIILILTLLILGWKVF